jgi:hypothetical protein
MKWDNYQYVVTYYYSVQNKKEDRKSSSYLTADYEVWNFINMKKPIQNLRKKVKILF